MSMILEMRGVDAGYGAGQVLHAVDISVKKSGITALLGANGAGKTTMLRAICSMVGKSAGEVIFDGRNISRLCTEDVVRLGIAHVPDGRGTFANFTVEENLRLGAYTRRDANVVADYDRIFGYFPRLKERWRQQAGTLSGGEQQMLAISRALMLKPRLLLLDEPSFGLAPLIVRDIFEILKTINRQEGVSVLVVEQNANLALDLADHAFVLETGRVVISGHSEEVRQNESIRRAYLGY